MTKLSQISSTIAVSIFNRKTKFSEKMFFFCISGGDCVRDDLSKYYQNYFYQYFLFNLFVGIVPYPQHGLNAWQPGDTVPFLPRRRPASAAVRHVQPSRQAPLVARSAPLIVGSLIALRCLVLLHTMTILLHLFIVIREVRWPGNPG